MPLQSECGLGETAGGTRMADSGQAPRWAGSARATVPSAALPAGKWAALRWAAEALADALPHRRVPPAVSVARPRWREQRARVLAQAQDALPAARYAVRSDAFDEDRPAASQAGRYLSLLDVAPGAVAEAIDAVFEGMSGHVHDQVLLQPMLAPTRRACVASTHRLSDGAPWYCIEFGQGDPAVVTGGRATGRHLAWPRALFTDPPAGTRVPAGPLVSDPDAAQVIVLLRALEACGLAEPFEIECLFTDDGAPWLLQLRALGMRARWAQPVPRPINRPTLALDEPELDLLGRHTALSLMSDWNPAELIGTHPRPLALSLFQALISRDSWWRARAQLGYRAPPRAGIDLLRPVLGRPYVDLRRSLNSLLPADLEAGIGARLVEAWVGRVRAQPELHDKLEFEVCRSVRDFAPAQAVRAALGECLDASAAASFEHALHELSLRLLGMPPRSEPHPAAMGAATDRGRPSVDTVRRLLRATGQRALTFAADARLAFAAEAQLRSAIARGALTPERAGRLRQSLRVTATSLGAHAHGSLWRPSSFDITQPLLPAPKGVGCDDATLRFELSPAETRAIGRLLREAGFALAPAAWLQWWQQCSRARETGKYALMQPLAQLLEALAALGALQGLDREALSWLPLPVLLRGLAKGTPSTALQARAERARRRAEREQRWLLGPVLRGATDLDAFDSLGLLPNFVGRRALRAPLHVLPHSDPAQTLPRGAIVAVPQADPGYDWLFARGIGGLITAWGGAHSHMAIRCAEFDLPAAIGCGEAVWTRLLAAHEAHLDPGAQALWLY